MASGPESVSIIKDNLKGLEKALAALTKQSVFVGVPSTKAGRKEGDHGEINNAVIAYVQTHGMPEQNVPARPFLEPGIRDASPQLNAIFKKIALNALAGNTTDVERGLNAAGLVGQAAAKKRIVDGIPPALKPATLAARRRRGHSGTTPLLETGQLLNSVSFVVRDK